MVTIFDGYYVNGMAIESNGNIIYANDNSLIRLKPTKTHCFKNDKKNM